MAPEASPGHTLLIRQKTKCEKNKLTGDGTQTRVGQGECQGNPVLGQSPLLKIQTNEVNSVQKVTTLVKKSALGPTSMSNLLNIQDWGFSDATAIFNSCRG